VRCAKEGTKRVARPETHRILHEHWPVLQTNDGAAPGTTRTEAAPDSARTHSSGTGGAAEKHMRSIRNLADIKGTLGGQEKGGQENGAAAKAADKPPPSFAKALGAIAPKMVHNLKSMIKEPPPKDVVDAHRKQHDVDDIKVGNMALELQRRFIRALPFSSKT
jgi:hypothetical protein